MVAVRFSRKQANKGPTRRPESPTWPWAARGSLGLEFAWCGASGPKGIRRTLIVPFVCGLIECRMRRFFPALTTQHLAEIIVPRRLNRSFTYVVPAHLQDRLQVGSLVTVPFGKTIVKGLVVALSSRRSGQADQVNPASTTASARLEPIPVAGLREILSFAEGTETWPESRLPPDLTLLLRQVSERYLTPWGQCLRLAFPSPPGSPQRGLARKLRGPSDPGQTGSRRPPPPLEAGHPSRAFQPGERSSAWLDRIRTELNQGRSATFLFQAPDRECLGCLAHAVRETLACQRRALILAPEIARVSAIARTATLLWGNRVAVFHSGMPAAVRMKVLEKIRNRTLDLVVGTRSAIFAPLDSLGLIWMQAEEDPSFKEEQAPRYHTREVARMRAQQHQAVLVLASSHPSVETLLAEDVEMLTRQEGLGGFQNPPSMHMVDLRSCPPNTFLSEAMLTGIETAIRSGTGAVLFLNRKGFAPSLLCRECGRAPQCKRCSVALTFHRKTGRLACTYCGASHSLLDTCPSCLAPRLEPVGVGTERIEEDLRRLFPKARIMRLDRDTARTPAQGEALRQQAASGQFDVLIGTQMLFAGSLLPQVGFVGLPHADAGLHLPDFRAAERAYHGLLDAVALANPAEQGGKVVLQTFLPNHYVIDAVFHNDPRRFVDKEVRFRKDLAYPPFSHLVRIGISTTNADAGKREADHWASLLNRNSFQGPSRNREVLVLGPIPAPVAKLRGRYRWQLLVKARDPETARRIVSASLTELENWKGRSRVKFDVDVDPVEMF